MALIKVCLAVFMFCLVASTSYAATNLPVSSIPQLPSLDSLRSVVEAGAPTLRLRQLPKQDVTSACDILLKGDFASFSFAQLLITFRKAQLSPENLTSAERDFLLAAVSLHIAIKLQQGNFGDLRGADEVLLFLGAESFQFSDEYLNVLRFWLSQLPSGMEVYGSLRIDSSRGEVDYSGVFIRERFIERDPFQRAQRQRDLIVEDHRRGIARATQLPPDLLNATAMQDFMKIREVLHALTRRTIKPPPNLLQLLRVLDSSNR